jgi:hypothetical protein
MLNFSEIIKLIKQYKQLKTNKAIANLLHIKQGTFNSQKFRESIPEKELILFCQRENLDYNGLLEGRIVLLKKNQDTSSFSLREGGGSSYGADITSRPISEDDFTLLISKAGAILRSKDDITVKALRSNIEAFWESINRRNNLEKVGNTVSCEDQKSEEESKKKVM